jgi:integrase
MGEKQSNFETQSESAKSAIIGQIARLVRRAGLDYEGWRYVSKRVRKACELRPAKKGRKLPKVLNADDFRKFYAEVDKADDAQHSLQLRLLFFTGVRVSELCNMLVADVDLDACKDPHQPGQRVEGQVRPLRHGDDLVASFDALNRMTRIKSKIKAKTP